MPHSAAPISNLVFIMAPKGLDAGPMAAVDDSFICLHVIKSPIAP